MRMYLVEEVGDRWIAYKAPMGLRGTPIVEVDIVGDGYGAIRALQDLMERERQSG